MLRTGNNRKINIALSVISVILALSIILTSVLFYVINKNVRMPEVSIDYGQTFVYPDFVNDGVVVGNNAKELFYSFDPESYSYCYMGKMDGYCSFENGNTVTNNGVEIVKKCDSRYYSYVQTSSAGEVPLIGAINVNSAKRLYLADNDLYLAQIDDNDDYADGDINWDNADFNKVDNPETDIVNLKSTIAFLAKQEAIKDSSDPNVYAANGKYYVTLDIDATKFGVNELLDVLGSKLFSQVMEIGKTLFNISNASLDMSELDIRMVVEFDTDDDGNLIITGRDCILKGTVKLVSLFSLNVYIDMSMSAVITYDSNYYTIYPDDLLNRF